jgi:hypothetical protein
MFDYRCNRVEMSPKPFADRYCWIIRKISTSLVCVLRLTMEVSIVDGGPIDIITWSYYS